MRTIARGFSVVTAILMMVAAMGPPSALAASETISDYTAYPPFLPQPVSPNILFMLDYSESMVRPAYGGCNTAWQDCDEDFTHIVDDFDSTQNYEGYFDPAYRYDCATGGDCDKVFSGGAWSGNFLNWLTMTQFDVLKKVAVGGDTTSAPEQSAPGSLRTRLTSGKTFYKVVDTEKCQNGSFSPLCSASEPQEVAYEWIPTPETAEDVETVLADYGDGRTLVETVDLPFDFSFYGKTFNEGHDLSVNENGWVSFDSYAGSKPVNYELPTFNLHNYTLAPYWQNLIQVKNADKNFSSAAKAFTVGTEGEQIFVITFENIVEEDHAANNDDPFTFQILLFEGSNDIVFQYKMVDVGTTFDRGVYATVGVQGAVASGEAKQYSHKEASLDNGLALFMTPGRMVYQVTPQNNSSTEFGPSPTNNIDYDKYQALINIVSTDTTDGLNLDPSKCPTGYYPSYFLFTQNQEQTEKKGNAAKASAGCFDHDVDGIVQEFRDAEDRGLLGFRLGIMSLVGDDGGIATANQGKAFNKGDDSGWSNISAAIRHQLPTDNTPLAEALFEAGGYFAQNTDYRLVDQHWDYATADCDGGSNINTDPLCYHKEAQYIPCAKNFALLISAGQYSHDNGTDIDAETEPVASDFTGTYGMHQDESWSAASTARWDVATAAELPAAGSWSAESVDNKWTREYGGWLDNVAYTFHVNDLRTSRDGDQNLSLFVVNTFPQEGSDSEKALKRAALFGGFKDVDGDGAYDDNGNEDNPDNPRFYLPVDNAGDIEAKIKAAVATILNNSASGTSVSVLSTSAGGEGSLYQAYFYPTKVEQQTQEVKWPGFLRGFFVDRFQNMRDDNSAESGNGTADAKLVLKEDRVVQMEMDPETLEINVNLIHDDDGVDIDANSIDETVTMDDVPSIWEAGHQLATRSDSNPRQVYFWLDKNYDGAIGEGDFQNASTTAASEAVKLPKPASMTNSLYNTMAPFLRAQETVYNSTTIKTANEEAAQILKFIYGRDEQDFDGFRSRCVDVGATNGTSVGCAQDSQKPWPLGDIVYSTPTLVATPGERYDILYGDTTYRNFVNTWHDRRSVVYTGANDGMLHAFNAGVFHAEDDDLDDTTAVEGYFEANPAAYSGTSAWDASTKMGDELWSFIPYDVLPHMVWLTCNGSDTDAVACGEAEYTHVYYMDHRPKATDVQIFSDTATGATGIDGQSGVEHPNGWGTILIAPMRLGGGAMDVDLDGSGSIDQSGEKFRSAYYAFDVTDPEQPPKLVWRFTDDDLGFSTSYPGIVRVEQDGDQKWYMVVGSGPANNTSTRDYEGKSFTSSGKVFVVDLADGIADRMFDTNTLDSGVFSIMGDPTVVDADLDYTADVIYIGNVIEKTAGRLYRINTNHATNPANWSFSTLFDVDAAANNDDPDPDNDQEMGPLLVAPAVSKDISGNLWVFFGTGKLVNTDDLKNEDQQRFYGIKDGCWDALDASKCTTDYTYELSDLMNSNAITAISTDKNAADQVNVDTNTLDVCGSSDTDCSYAELLATARSKSGWYADLIGPTTNEYSEKVLSRPSVLGGLVLFTTYAPSRDLCSILGESQLYGLYYETGTAYIEKTLPQEDSDTEVAKSVSLGKGMPTSVGVAIGETVSGFVQKSTGEIIRVETSPGLGVRSGYDSWREKSRSGSSEIESIYKHIVK